MSEYTTEVKVEHMLRTRLARQAADMAVQAYAGFPQPQILRLEEILPTMTPTSHADSEAAFTYKSFGEESRKIVAFVKLYRFGGHWNRLEVDLCETLNGQRQGAHYSFWVMWTHEQWHPYDCPSGTGPLVGPLG